MSEKIMVSFQAFVAEREAMRTAGEKENRSLSNYILNSALERAKEKHGIIPAYENGDSLEKGE